MRTVDVKPAAAAAQHHATTRSAASSEASKSTKPAARRPTAWAATRPSNALSTGPWTTTRHAEIAGLFPSFAHPLVEFIGVHLEHADTGIVARDGNRFRRYVWRNARYRHS